MMSTYHFTVCTVYVINYKRQTEYKFKMPKLLPSNSALKVNTSSLLTIYATAENFLDPDAEATGADTPPSSKEEFDDNLLRTSHLLMKIIEKTNEEGPPQAQRDKSLAEYAVENVHTEIALIVKQVKGRAESEKKSSISYNVEDQLGHVIFTIDGNKTVCCGTHVLLKGENEVVRGTVSSHGISRYLVKDFLTGNHYQWNLPCWVTFCTCFMYWFYPALECKQISSKQETITSLNQIKNTASVKSKSKSSKASSDEMVAVIGKQKWKGTRYENNKAVFGVKFLRRHEDADTKLLVFCASLVMFHLYFKTGRGKFKCLMIYNVILLIILGLGGLLVYFILIPKLSKHK